MYHVNRRFHLRHKIGHVRSITESSHHFWWQKQYVYNIHESESVSRVFAPNQAHLRNLSSLKAT